MILSHVALACLKLSQDGTIWTPFSKHSIPINLTTPVATPRSNEGHLTYVLFGRTSSAATSATASSSAIVATPIIVLMRLSTSSSATRLPA